MLTETNNNILDTVMFQTCPIYSLTIPSTVTGIGTFLLFAFYCKFKMFTLKIKIGSSSFQHCTLLSFVSLTIGLTILSDYIFQYDNSLQEISIPSIFSTKIYS